MRFWSWKAPLTRGSLQLKLSSGRTGEQSGNKVMEQGFGNLAPVVFGVWQPASWSSISNNHSVSLIVILATSNLTNVQKGVELVLSVEKKLNSVRSPPNRIQALAIKIAIPVGRV